MGWNLELDNITLRALEIESRICVNCVSQLVRIDFEIDFLSLV
jgi:hypothetical protein